MNGTAESQDRENRLRVSGRVVDLGGIVVWRLAARLEGTVHGSHRCGTLLRL